MAQMYNIKGLSYTPQENPEWFTRAMYGARLLEQGYVLTTAGVKDGQLLNLAELTSKILQIDGKDCAWTPNQIIKLSEAKASVKTYKINLEQCIEELENKRLAHSMKAGAKADELPADLEAATMMLLSIELSNEIEEMLVGGDPDKNPNDISGFETLMLDSTTSLQLKGATLTMDNVIGAVESVYAAIPEDVLQAGDRGELYCFVSYKARRLLRMAIGKNLKNDSLAELWSTDDTDKRNPRIFFGDLEIVPVKGIGADTLIAFARGNFWFLTDLMSDLDNIELGHMAPPHDSKIFIRGRLRLGTHILFPDEAVIWSDQVSADRLTGVQAPFEVSATSLLFDAAGGTKAFNITTKKGVAPVLKTSGTGFTATAGEATTVGNNDVTPVSVVAAAYNGGDSANTGQIAVSIADNDLSVTVTLNQRGTDYPNVTA